MAQPISSAKVHFLLLPGCSRLILKGSRGRYNAFAISFRNSRCSRLSLSAFDGNLAHWSQLGPAGALSTSFESWGSTQRGKGIVRISVDAIVGQRETR